MQIVYKQNPEVSELSTLKRSHDQISFLENDKSEQALKREAAAENIPELLTSHTAFPGSEKKAKLFAVGASYPNMGLPTGAGGTAAANGTVLEKGDYSHQTHEGQFLLDKRLDRFPGVKVYDCVSSQHASMMSPKSLPNTRTIQEVRTAKDVITGAVPASSHSLPIGKVHSELSQANF